MSKKGSSNSSNRGNMMSAEMFLGFKSRVEIEQQTNLDYAARQIVAQLASTDLAQAEKVFQHYILLASTPSLNAANVTEETKRANFEMVLSQLVNVNPKLETVAVALKMIDAAGDPGKGVYLSLENGIRMALQQTRFASLEEVSAPLFAASGKINLRRLIPFFMERFGGLPESTVVALAVAPEGELAKNSVAVDLSACARLFLVAQGKGERAPVEEEFIARLQKGNENLSSKLYLVPSIGSAAVQGEAWKLTDVCLDLLKSAWADTDIDVQLKVPASLLNALAGAKESESQRGAMKTLLDFWSRNIKETPMAVATLKQVLTLAPKVDIPVESFLDELPESVQRQPGLLPLLVRNGAAPLAGRVLPWSFMVMPPLAQMSRNRGGGYRIVNGVQVREQNSKNAQRPDLNLGQDVYDKGLHEKLQSFLGTIEDPGQRFFAEFLVSALQDGAENPPEVPVRDDRLAALARRYDRKAFSNPYLAEHAVSWLAAAIGVTDEFRDDVAYFGRALDSRLMSQWNDGYLKTSRQGVMNHFIQDASKSDPEAFTKILEPVLEQMAQGNGDARRFLDSYCSGFPGNVLQDSASLTPEEAARFLPVLRKLCVVSINNYWNGRDQCFNGNLVLHVLANRMEEYKVWLKDQSSNTRRNLEQRVNITQIIALLKNSLSSEDQPEERRFEILNGLFAATSVSQNSSSSSSSSNSQVFNFMVEQKVISKEEILKHGPRWAEANPRDGAAFGELAKYQAEAGLNEEAVLNYLRAVINVPAGEQRLYSQFSLEKANLLLNLGRTEAAVNWFGFVQPSRIYSSNKDTFEELHRSARVQYLTDASRSEAVMSDIRQALKLKLNRVARVNPLEESDF
jgi:tetratricopeptide (TPR) repeat protein